MIDGLSKENSSRILLLITKELIIHSKSEQTIELEKNLKLIKELEFIRKPLVSFSVPKKRVFTPRDNFFNSPVVSNSNFVTPKKEVFRSNSFRNEPFKEINPEPIFNVPSNINSSGRVSKLVIPDVNLPERFQYLRPAITREELDLGRLNPLIRNPQVREIECDGPDTEVVVKNPAPRKTDIFLTTEEIRDVFIAFSKVAKIPVEENVIKIAAGNLILNGINSDVIGSKFIIRKIQPVRIY